MPHVFFLLRKTAQQLAGVREIRLMSGRHRLADESTLAYPTSANVHSTSAARN